jgi:hypothetical protein
MGAFTLLLDRRLAGYREIEKRQLEAMAAQGFATPRKLEAGQSVLFVYPKQVVATDNVRTFAGNDFVAVCGTFFYRGRTGREGLGLIYRDFVSPSPESEAPASEPLPAPMHGTYACVVFKAGRLYVFTDRIGLYKVYRSTDDQVLSSSFLTVTACTPNPRLNAHCVFEYVFQGATYDGETAVRGVSLLDADSIIEIVDGSRRQLQRLPLPLPVIEEGSLLEHSERIGGQLDALFNECARAFQGCIDTALSGGYDSRLILAHLLKSNVTPAVHVYGQDTDSDVRIAKAIAAGEGFAISHVDKRLYRQRAREEELPDIVDKNFYIFDGLPVDGIFDDGVDLATRQDRARNGALALNGGGGEIFRNFFILRDRPLSSREIVWTFYSQFDPNCFAENHDPLEYQERLAEKIGNAVGVRDRRLTRAEVERVFPVFRCRFWMGKNSSINNRLGLMHTPLVEPVLVASAGAVPLSIKNSGKLAAALILRASPQLARYPSAYGYPFHQDVPIVRRIADWISTQRPPRVRKVMFPLKAKLKETSLIEAKDKISHFGKLFDHSDWHTRGLIRYDRVLEPSQIRRLLTIEYFCEKMGARI